MYPVSAKFPTKPALSGRTPSESPPKVAFLLLCGLNFFAVQQSLAQVFGCTDPLATNFNPSATDNDGSCVYAATSVTPEFSIAMTDTLSETSGLFFWNNLYWTHNDNADPNFYAIDSTNGNIVNQCNANGLVAYDWEETTQDSNFVYIGDFGNNANGNRQDLRIFKILKTDLCGTPQVDTIAFAYEDQVDFTPTGSNNTDFDCEAFVVFGDSIYLFTKQWNSQQTTLYALPKAPGSYTAHKRATFNVDGLITGAALSNGGNVLTLCGYTTVLQPFVYLMYDFNDFDFFSGNKRRIALDVPNAQVEAVATQNGLVHYLTNEATPIFNTPQSFYKFDFMPYLTFLHVHTFPASVRKLQLHPNPADGFVSINFGFHQGDGFILRFVDPIGRTVKRVSAMDAKVALHDLPNNVYAVQLEVNGTPVAETKLVVLH